MNKKIFAYTMILSTIISMCHPMTIKAASYSARISTDGVRLRQNPTTKNSNILDTLDTNNQITVLDENKIAGEGCNDGWLKVSYNGVEGYVCSKYITTEPIKDDYDRPWNTPEKAIIGGAKFIAKSYISKGQFTSYLKKFNVNPNGTYAVYNHEYQANVMAPSNEAISSWKAYDTTGSMDLPFNFSIPVYNNMAESYLHPAGKKANLDTADVQDETFEESIKDFPDTYKPYLRSLHKDHPSWKFTPLMTNLDFMESATIERENASIYKTESKLTKKLDGNGNPIPTNEKDWYEPTVETVSYYMDPRNFLNESYIFQFEDLTNSDTITEEIVQSVLNKNDLIKGYDLIDNKTYASIYMEAGKQANVNPVYLASLSVQEVGSQTLLVTGEEFIYENVTYSGLFNFFNIGASSSASNPLRKGLVYASGGMCTICATYDASTQTTTEEQNKPVEEAYDKVKAISNIGGKTNGGYISGFNIGEGITTLQEKESSISYSSNDIIKTGMTITLKDGTSYTVVIYGDTNSDGKINSADLLKIKQYLLEIGKLSDAEMEAADVNHNGKINSANLLKIKQYLLGTNKIDQ